MAVFLLHQGVKVSFQSLKLISFYSTPPSVYECSKSVRGQRFTRGSCVIWTHFKGGPGRLQGRQRCTFHCNLFFASCEKDRTKERSQRERKTSGLEPIRKKMKEEPPVKSRCKNATQRNKWWLHLQWKFDHRKLRVIEMRKEWKKKMKQWCHI